MNCKKVLPRLSAFQDRELSAQSAEQIENHLKNCTACRAELKALNRLVGNLCSLTPPVPAPGFSSRIMTGLLKRPDNKFRLLPSLAYTLACLTIFFIGFFLEISSSSQPAIPPQLTTTFSTVLTESRDLGLLAVQDSTMGLFSGDAYEKQ